MTPKQEQTVQDLRKALEWAHMPHIRYADSDKAPENGWNVREFKQWKVKELEWGKVSVVSEIGMVGDEGTLAFITRDYRHIFIGKRGGVQLANAKLKSKSRGWFNVVHGLTY